MNKRLAIIRLKKIIYRVLSKRQNEILYYHLWENLQFFLYQGELDGLVEEEGEYNQQREDEVDGFVKVHIALYI